MSQLNVYTLVSLLVLTGCLQTRSELGDGETKQTLHTQVKTIQASSAQNQNRFEEMEEQMRKLNGKIELLESRIDDLQASMKSKNDFGAQDEKLKLHEDSISRLEAEVAGLKQAMIEMPAATQAAAKAEPVVTSGPMQSGDMHFEKKEYREAILSYEKYREANPKGKFWAKATLRIGMSFQSLGLKKEANAFYQEVIDKASKTTEAKIASQKLKAK